MSYFDTFDTAVHQYRKWLADCQLPTELLWLVRSRVRWNLTSLYVFQPGELTDSSPHRERFDLALRNSHNIAICHYAVYDGRSLISLDTPGLDFNPKHCVYHESGSCNYQIMQVKERFQPVESRLKWQFVKRFVRNSNRSWNDRGWPP